MQGLFEGCNEVTSVGDLSLWKPYNLRHTARMFSYCRNLTDASIWHFDISRVTDMNHMFNYCEKLENIDVSSWDISRVTNMNHMFCHTNDENIISQLQNWKPSSIENLSYFLSGTPIVDADLSIWPEVVNKEYRFAPNDISYMFSDCTELRTVNLKDWMVRYTNFAKPQDVHLAGLFKGCTNLTSIDMTNWPKLGGSKESMFEGCASLPESIIHDFVEMYSNDDSFDTTNISRIFTGCNQVTSLDWSNVTLTKSINFNNEELENRR